MAIQFSVSVRNGMLDAIETVTGTSAVLKIRSGSAPANCAASDSGTVLATLSLPSDWLANASNGSKAKSGSWEDLEADGTGVAGHFRVYASDGSTCVMQGDITQTGGGGSMTLDNVSIAVNQTVTVTGFQLNSGNA